MTKHKKKITKKQFNLFCVIMFLVAALTVFSGSTDSVICVLLKKVNEQLYWSHWEHELSALVVR